MPDRARLVLCALTCAATTTIASAPALAADEPTGLDVHYTVERGDSLWTIASEILPPGTQTSEVVRVTSRIWNLNRDRIGNDPGLLVEGERLRLR